MGQIVKAAVKAATEYLGQQQSGSTPAPVKKANEQGKRHHALVRDAVEPRQRYSHTSIDGARVRRSQEVAVQRPGARGMNTQRGSVAMLQKSPAVRALAEGLGLSVTDSELGEVLEQIGARVPCRKSTPEGMKVHDAQLFARRETQRVRGEVAAIAAELVSLENALPQSQAQRWATAAAQYAAAHRS